MTTWICILNWNGGRDTLATLQTVLALPDAVVCVLDNGSTDDSVAVLQDYLEKEGVPAAMLPEDADLAAAATTHRVLVVRSATNRGFAGGNNVLLRAALQAPGARYAWLLNNDALANPQTLPALLQAMQADPRLGFAGSVILDGRQPDLIQCCGVRYFQWLGISKLLAKNQPHRELVQTLAAVPPPDFQHGASLLVRLDAAREVGILDERFFLYFEEQDWQRRGRNGGWANRLVPESTVAHLGSMSTDRHKHLFFYYYNRSAAIFARLHNPWLVRACNKLALPAILLLRTRGSWNSFRWGWKGLRQGWRTPL